MNLRQPWRKAVPTGQRYWLQRARDAGADIPLWDDSIICRMTVTFVDLKLHGRTTRLDGLGELWITKSRLVLAASDGEWQVAPLPGICLSPMGDCGMTVVLDSGGVGILAHSQHERDRALTIFALQQPTAQLMQTMVEGASAGAEPMPRSSASANQPRGKSKSRG